MTLSVGQSCERCGKPRPEEGAVKQGWRRTFCPPCYHVVMGYPPSTEAVRRYRADPEKRKRDNAASLSWKERNRERNRARDRAYKAQQRAATRLVTEPGRLGQQVDRAVAQLNGEAA